jgi:preprotein translocase subunit Sss1
MTDKGELDFGLQDESVIKRRGSDDLKSDDLKKSRTTEMETQHGRSYLMLTLAVLSKCISESVMNLVLSTQTFLQDCKYFFKRCTFPDLEGTYRQTCLRRFLMVEFCSVMKRISCMLVILGALSYVIPLVFIVIKDILQT